VHLSRGPEGKNTEFFPSGKRIMELNFIYLIMYMLSRYLKKKKKNKQTMNNTRKREEKKEKKKKRRN
jgi:hypothetical protein